MNVVRKCIFHVTLGFIMSLLLVTATFATTEFYLLPDDVEQRIECDFLEINNNQVICTDNNLLVTYDLARIKNLEMVYEGKSYQVQNFTQDAIKSINNINSNKTDSKNAEQQKSRGQTSYTSWKSNMFKKFSFDSFSDFVQSLKNRYRHQSGNSISSMILLGSGLFVFIIGSLGYLIATFRVGILWGLGCILLPFVSFVFLFVHWKVAAKPFFVSMLGVVIAFSGTLLGPAGRTASQITKSQPVSLAKKEKVDERFKCSGKMYCSEMTSCAEAKFYLQNCPGTKMDGNNDGVPCEKQWCGQ